MDDPRELLAAGERILAGALGGGVRLGAPERLGGTRRRSGVWRVPLAGGPSGAPESVVLKRATGDDGPAFDSDGGDEPESPVSRFFAEWAGYLFLGTVAGGAMAPRLYGVDRALGVLALEDLGEGECLADRLTGADPHAAERALLAYAAALGRLHAATAGRRAELDTVRERIGARGETDAERETRPGVWRRECVAPFLAACESLGVGAAPGVEREADAVAAMVERPGALEAFTPGDTCPDNHRLEGGGVRFFDFEFCGFRHALLDAAYFRSPFPSCWCVHRLPEGVPARMEAAYRAELAPARPEVADDAAFRAAMARASAYWLLWTLGLAPDHGLDLAGALAQDRPWGPASVRQRHLLRLETFAAHADARGTLPALAETAAALAGRLRALWPDASMPLYPPFRAAAEAADARAPVRCA
ncbi:MAG TPA: hypothetical protein VF746_32440 [Longimicrobium sp.]|jgi:hypothetical protein